MKKSVKKIALIGAQGVGKTSLGGRLLEEVKGSVLVKETVRECPYPLDQQADFKTEWWATAHSILAEQEAIETGGSLIVTDRCLLDIAVYTKLIQSTNDGRISVVQRELIENTIQHWLKEAPYDTMFFLRVKDEVWKSRDLNDGFRSTDFGWYQILTKEFEGVLERFQMSKKTQLIEIWNDGDFEQTYQKIASAL